MHMNLTLAYLRGRRTWLVQGFAVWGSDYDAEFLMAAAEKVASDTRLGFWRVSLGGQAQEVSFTSLVDYSARAAECVYQIRQRRFRIHHCPNGGRFRTGDGRPDDI
jgi:hypothetical protein